MMWKEIKTWATSKGYKVDRKSIDGVEKKYLYSWTYNSIDGVAYSTNELALNIYNHMTDNKFVKHQEDYNKNQVAEDIYIASVAQW